MSRASRARGPVLRTLDIGCRTGSRKGMNDPEVTMSNALANTNLIAHEKALAAAGDAISLVLRVPAPLKSIADQVIRSASSVPANLAEGHGRSGRDRVHFWRIAYACKGFAGDGATSPVTADDDENAAQRAALRNMAGPTRHDAAGGCDSPDHASRGASRAEPVRRQRCHESVTADD